MKYYFSLQLKLMNRFLKDFGIPPIAACLFLLILFPVFSYLIFIKTKFAPYLYFGMATGLLLMLQEPKRINFVKTIFNTNEFYKIRLVENLIICLPFAAFLVFKQDWWFAISLLIPAFLFSRFSLYKNIAPAIPTPFFRYPFEFIVGFRKSWYLIILLYAILFFAMKYQNFNLAIICLFAVFLICGGFYGIVEDQFFVWIYNSNAKQFLNKKIGIAILYASLLSVPVLFANLISFSNMWIWIILVQLFGYIYVSAMVTVKYASFPDQINFPQLIMIIGCIVFPPFALVAIPYFYIKALKKLHTVLQ